MNAIFDNFPSGYVLGILSAAFIGFILDRIREARGQMGQQNRTFDTYTDAERPHLTSARVVRRSVLGTLGCVFWVIFLGFGLYAVWLVSNFVWHFKL